MLKKIKIENQILVMLAFFSISLGLWENFRQLWLQDNNFSATKISNIISIGTFVSVIGILLVGKYISLNKLKGFVSATLFIKFINMLLLYFLNKTNNNIFINISIIIDITTGYLITTSIYPLITTIIKSNTVYSKRKLTEYLFRDIGILFGGIFIGKELLGVLVNYNICLYISIIFLAIAMITLFNISNSVIKVDKKQEKPIVKIILENKILIVYLIYVFIGTIAMSTGLGLKMLTLTNYFNFSDNLATNYLLIVGLVADAIGIIALKWLTPKNDYLTVTIKFGIRFIGYVAAFLSNNIIITLIAITWSILISTAYENIVDGYYVNAVDSEYQLSFTNVRYVIKYLGEAIGIFLCGIMYAAGLRYMFGLSAFFMIFQIGIAYYLIYLRKNNTSNDKIKNRKRLYNEYSREEVKYEELTLTK